MLFYVSRVSKCMFELGLVCMYIMSVANVENCIWVLFIFSFPPGKKNKISGLYKRGT